MKQVLHLLLLFFATLPVSATHYTIETIPNVQKANIHRFVSNPDGILDANTQHYLNTRIDSLRQRTSAEIAVVVVNSIGTESIETFATQLFAAWGIGKKENDNGLLVLFVLDQRKIRFETGYGIEGILTDALCKRIQTRDMLPAFRQGDYATGLRTGIDNICQIIEQPEYRDEVFVTSSASDEGSMSTIQIYIIISLILSFLLLSMVQPWRTAKDPVLQYRAYESQRTTLILMAIIFPMFNLITLLYIMLRMRNLRNKNRTCENCGHRMHKLNEVEDNKFLNERENAEEILNSVDYDVWLCDKCGMTEIFAFPNKHSHYAVCPKCGTRAYALESDQVLRPSTHMHDGTGKKTYHCKHCHHRDFVLYSIPMLITPIIIGGGGGNHRGGGFGGGSFGGGFGGGLSGGGGATSGW